MKGANETSAGLARGRRLARAGLALFYLGAGCLHLIAPGPFVLIVPDFAPDPHFVVAATGVCEIFGAIGVLIPRLRRFAGVMLALYAICVLPANVKHAFGHVAVPGLPSSWWYHGPRLALQPAIVWWALFAGGLVSWPFGRAAHATESLRPPFRSMNGAPDSRMSSDASD